MMQRNKITKSGVTVDVGVDDREDAIALVNFKPWQRFYLRRLDEERERLAMELATLKSDSVVPYRELQARIQTIDDLKKIPYRLIKPEKE